MAFEAIGTNQSNWKSVAGFHPENLHFVENKFQIIRERAPFLSDAVIQRHYLTTVKEHDYRKANLELLNLSERLRNSEIRFWWDDDQLSEFCESKAAQCRRLSLLSPMPGWEIRELVRHYKFEMPLKDIFGLEGAIARTCDSIWWRREVRKYIARECDELARNMRLVSTAGQIYCSDVALSKRRMQQRRAKGFLQNSIAENELGHTFLLSELADKSVSNPVVQRAELMTRIRGFEEVAELCGHVGLFVTVTNPSKYHPMKRIKHGDSEIALPNKKYSGASVRDAQAFHCKQYSLLRSWLNRRGVRPYGFRVVEPHHDGCPHWHFLVFAPKADVGTIKSGFREYWLRESGNEPGAKKSRVTFVDIDPAKGTAAGYIAKYIAKNIDGFAIDSDLYGRCAADSAEKILAWKSTHSIRQFQQVGGPSVTVWRELRRISNDDNGKNYPFSEIWEAADTSDWAAFVMLMGGPSCARDGRPLLPLNDVLIKNLGDVYSPPKNKYGEAASRTTVGLVWVKTGFQLITKVHEWVIRRVDEVRDGAANLGDVLKVGASPPLDLCQ